jgi:hypothetical protein
MPQAMMAQLPRSAGLLLVAAAVFLSIASGGGDDDVVVPVTPGSPATPEDAGAGDDPGDDPILVPDSCGDGVCWPDSECGVCEADCANIVQCLPQTCEGDDCAYCGDWTCEHGLEDCGGCAADCGICGEATDEGDKLLDLINAARAAGLSCPTSGWQPPTGPLTKAGELAAAARAYSLDMAAQDFFSHTGLDGSTPPQRVDDAGYAGSFRGENLAAGYLEAQSVFDGWHSSDGHCVVMMHPSANEAGLGYGFDDSSTYRHYWTLELGYR